MPFSGSGTFSRVYNWQDDKNAAIPITASRMDTEDDGFAAGLSNCITRDGQSPATANLPMGGYKLTGMAAGSTAGDSVRYEQVVLLSAGANQTITRTAAGTVLTLESTDAGASMGPVLKLHRNSASPASNDAAGGIDFDGDDSAGNQTTYGRIYSVITDPADGSEDGVLAFSVMTAGALADELVLTGATLYPATDAGLDLGAASQRFAAAHVNTIELGNASDTTLSRSAAGIVAVEGVDLIRSNAADATKLLGNLASYSSTLATSDRVPFWDATDSTWKYMTLQAFMRAALDAAFGSTKGQILYRGTSNWAALNPP